MRTKFVAKPVLLFIFIYNTYKLYFCQINKHVAENNDTNSILINNNNIFYKLTRLSDCVLHLE